MTLFDLITIVILLVSALVGFTRGAVKEIVTVVAFTLAALAGVFMLPYVGPLVREMMDPPWAATGVAVLVVFVVAYIALRLAGHWLTSKLHARAALGTIDRVIGLGFGLLRAFVFLGVFYLVFNLATPPELTPRWIADARLLPVARGSANVIRSIAPEGLKMAGGLAPALERAVTEGAAPVNSGDSDYLEGAGTRRDAAPRPSREQTGQGYDNRSRDSIDDLVEQSR